MTEAGDNGLSAKAKENDEGARSPETAEEVRAHLAAVVAFSDDAIITKSLKGIIRSWNKGAERIFGYLAEEAIGKPVAMLMPPDRVNEEPRILERLSRGERIDHYETVRMKKDGSLIDISLSVSPIRNAEGQIIGASKIARDITPGKRLERALRESESRLRAVVEATPECVKIVDPDGALVFMNPAGIRMIEADAPESVHGACVFDLIAPEHRNDWIEQHSRVCAGDRVSWEFEVVGLRGTRRWMESHAVPLALPNGRNAQLAVTRDITARKTAEANQQHLLELERAARAEAERISVMKDQFLATLSHELRTPLNAILGWAQVLRGQQEAGTEIAEGLEVIERNTQIQTQLIEDLLDMSRIVSGNLRLDVRAVDLQDAIRAAVASVRHSADAKGIRLQVVLDPLAGPVHGDGARLQQCFWNLLSNAIKFTPRGGKIQVTLERVNSHLEICVIDNGQGISPEFLPHVFERFRQADASTTRRTGGLGLGLSIVKHLVELHGGSVRAKSPGEGKGATLCIQLPVIVAHQMGDEGRREHPQTPTYALSPMDHPSLAGIKVLAVDDEADARRLVQRILESCGAKVITAASVAEALDAVVREHPDVILSDIGMPGEDGYELMKKVRALSPAEGGKTPAAALTAFARAEDRTRALRAGYQSHVAKPVQPTELTAVVSSLAINR